MTWEWVWGITWDVAYQALVGGLICGAIFLVTIVLLEWFGGC